MALYRFDDLLLEVHPDDAAARARLTALYDDLSWTLVDAVAADEQHLTRVSVRLYDGGRPVPATARPVLTTTSFCGWQDGDAFYLTDGESLLHLKRTLGEADAFLAESFFARPLMLQYTFWSFGIAMLLRQTGRYVLHAAGLVDVESDVGALVVGPSGSGKTTLTLAAVREGWRYVSDDSGPLQRPPGVSTADAEPRARRVTALGGRKHCYIDAGDSSRHEDLVFGSPADDAAGGTRRKALLDRRYPGRKLNGCVPRLLLFPRIVDADESALFPVNQVSAFAALLDASCDQLWDRRTMPHHAAVLTDLIRQAPAYELRAGRDIHRDPSILFRQLGTVLRGEDLCTES